MNDLEKSRIDKYEELVRQGKDPFLVDSFEKNAFSLDIREKYANLENDEKANETVILSGRLMSKRELGQICFGHVLDKQGQIQLVIQNGETTKECFEIFSKLDTGDIIGVKGKPYKTKRGEVSVLAQEITLLSKSVYPLPEKWHGLKDPDTKFRQRYVDLIVNQESKQKFIQRAKLISGIREFMESEGFLEVETPMLQPIPGGAAARPFITHHNTLDIDLYLRIAPELYLKRLIVGGFEKIYEINRNFRNEGFSHKHNPEFTMMEFYWAYVNFETLMEFTEKLFASAVKKTVGGMKVEFDGKQIDFTPPFERLSFSDALKKFAKVDLSKVKTDADARKEAERLGINTKLYGTRDKILDEIFGEFVEKNIRNPVFITGYPVEFCSLAKRNRKNPALVDRFELIVAGMELVNAYSELNNPFDQEKRFMEQAEKKSRGDETAEFMDLDYVHALKIGMPPTGGFGLGIDRLAMLLTDSHSIKEVIFFPQTKPKEEESQE